MKQIQLGRLDPRRLLTYVLSRLVESHGVEQTMRNSRIATIDAGEAELPPSQTRAAGDILRTAERRWPSRYY